MYTEGLFQFYGVELVAGVFAEPHNSEKHWLLACVKNT
jgi:hypothetical protein